MKQRDSIRIEMNRRGKQGEPFIFLFDFLMEQPLLFNSDDTSGILHWQTPYSTSHYIPENIRQLRFWKPVPESFETYCKGFDLVQKHILEGDTYLLNYTRPTPVETNLKIQDIFQMAVAPYKIMLKNKFVCFSPEPFVKVEQGRIFSFPMKGTIDATVDNAEELIMSDPKELAEHHTIVDLIRNDLSLISENVTVEEFRYLQRIRTNRKDLWQVSSRITGKLHDNYHHNIGDILFAMLPAGSVSGAPKKKTVEIILEAENYERGYYTGIFGIFDGKSLDSCVLIRFVEEQNGQLVFKSGGGITFMSEAETEYKEMLNKVYVPVG